jgi:signal transduction histidine kinase/CheY-like chemotaxis protein
MSEGVALHEIVYDDTGEPVDYRLLDLNPACESILGLTRRDAIGALGSELEGCRPPRHMAIYAVVAASGVPARFESRVPVVDRNFRVRVFSTTPGCFTTIIEDLTDRLRLEEQLRRAQKLEAVGRMASTVAHDLNNLLLAIMGYSEMVAEQLAPGDPRRADTEQIRAASETASALTRELLDFSRRQVWQTVTVDVVGAVERLGKMLHRILGDSIELSLRSDAPALHIRGDRGRIDQVIMNLVLNAKDAMPSGGSLSIEVRRADIRDSDSVRHALMKPGRYVLLAVSDTGVGMDAATQARVFEPFFTTKEAGKGTGLGLFTVYGIVKEHGGYVWVYSEPSRGTCFKLYFPAVDPEPGPGDGAAPMADAERSRPARILVVDDEEAARRVAVEALRRRGFVVVEAAGAALARDLLAEAAPIDVAVIDLVLEEADGRELADAVRTAHPGAAVVFTSGFGASGLEAYGLDAEAPFVPKPFTESAMLGAVQLALARRG